MEQLYKAAHQNTFNLIYATFTFSGLGQVRFIMLFVGWM